MAPKPPTAILNTPPYVILDDSRQNGRVPGHSSALLFHNPRFIIEARAPEDLNAALEHLDSAVADGLYAAGFISYEAAPAFDAAFTVPPAADAPQAPPEKTMPGENSAKPVWPKPWPVQLGQRPPLLWMLMTDQVEDIDMARALAAAGEGSQRRCDLTLDAPLMDGATYRQKFDALLSEIRSGGMYQTNLTFPIPARLAGHAPSLYAKLRRAQPAGCGAFIATGEHHILSLSPELFLEASHADTSELRLTSRPMKGTAARHLAGPAANDKAAALAMQRDDKTRAENLMIVDLIRNDLSRLARPGSVKVPRLFTLETLPSVHQLTSDVTAISQTPHPRPTDLLRALFPCGSVTGAPKIAAMHIIADLEEAPRGVYCGAIGCFAPSGEARLNVAIRTLVFDATGRGRLDVGSGVVADSDAESEYRECLDKAVFAEGLDSSHLLSDPDLMMIETMRLRQDGSIPRKELHLDRLEASAHALQFRFSRKQCEAALERVIRHVSGAGDQRLRVLLSRQGVLSLSASPLPPPPTVGATPPAPVAPAPPATPVGSALAGDAEPGLPSVRIAREHIDQAQPARRFKTSDRALYDAATAIARQAGLADILFFNQQGRLAEGAVSSVIAVIGGKRVTPPLQDGALPGVMRRTLLDDAGFALTEAPITRAMLLEAETLYLCNSVRGLYEVALDAEEEIPVYEATGHDARRR